ncbi:bifunctional protein-serine/threonine kinase/phosphatase [Marinobacter zhejiangensis]|uniref:Protein phosphatase n=1 Tax=Marinobacter zhejiangensis TaxID=488535 RepID=A0A1I4Q4M0_9GAMM|nr:bifunctional protein-serine/threonine kinase/phosphatase [Marinobacter zhejiangensis]SFM35048.1 protein phosphatase [Marinobacter zhejiangensis]
MRSRLQVSVGHCSDKGVKPINQDFLGWYSPREPQLGLKGIAFAMADGISTSDVSHIASDTTVSSFLNDYYCTSDAWSVRTAVERVVSATNSWLYAQGRNSPYCYERDKGYVCTLSALVLKSTYAHLFHAGDTRIYRLRNRGLEQLTTDHRTWVSSERSYLSRALGAAPEVELDYRSLPLQAGDYFVLTTDGIHEYCDANDLIRAIQHHRDNLDTAAKRITELALQRGSDDNLSVQIVRVDEVPTESSPVLHDQIEQLPIPPLLEAQASLDGYTIVRELHASHRSHVYLAVDELSGNQVVIKTPSIDLQGDEDYLERLLMEEWVARRVNSRHVQKASPPTRQRHYLYTVMEYIEGQTLAQWLADNPQPDLETVRGIIEQVAHGLNALHRMEVLHQDIRPNNLMIDAHGTVKIIDFGSARVAGIVEASTSADTAELLGTALYMAPEYFMGELGTTRSDLYSLGVLAYHLLSGKFPYDADVARTTTAASLLRLNYRSVLNDERAIPAWVDETLRKAVHPNPEKRYQELSEFTYDLRHPNKAYLNKTRPPLIERNPVAVWQGISAILAGLVILLLNQ